ncbi:MAG: hypothetical protein Ct9H300mP12_15010 [Acidimicrobiales bacterium]|nr:MAG: hypothetical protein Ct9H300mP12_15010 [Acidimicrobiales bacterium]
MTAFARVQALCWLLLSGPTGATPELAGKPYGPMCDLVRELAGEPDAFAWVPARRRRAT